MDTVTEITKLAIADTRARTTPAAPVALSRADIDASPVPLLLVQIQQRQATATLQKAGENGKRVTWFTSDGTSVTTEDGIIVATRGFGDDLYAADTTEIRANLRDGGTGTRVHEYLTGLDQVVRPSFSCEIKATRDEVLTIVERNYATVRYEERCKNAQFDFTNVYWVDSSNEIRQSQQWLSPAVGYLVTQSF